jgi:hypothetical protein
MEPRLLLQSIIQDWPIDKFVLYARNPRENDAVVDRMWSSISKFGFKIPITFPALSGFMPLDTPNHLHLLSKGIAVRNSII